MAAPPSLLIRARRTMDPALEEAVRRGPPDREIEAAALLAPDVPPPADLRVVATFGEVVTCRLRVDRVADVRRHPAVHSLKAGREVGPTEARLAPPTPGEPAPRSVPDATGAGCVLAFLDWGCDFAHPNFRREDGGTRLRAIWDQRGPGDGNRWGYGRVLERERIDAALRAQDPYSALRYHPGSRAAHGTHVMDIAAGNGRLPGAARGLAPEADLAFVHLASGLRPGQGDLGDSVRVLEALDFARDVAGSDPLVVNMSLGRTAGDHSGTSFVERGMDALLEGAPGRAIVQSAGNYFGKRLHAAGRLGPGRSHALEWVIAPGDPTSNELEIWYSGRDRFSVELVGPGSAGRVLLARGERAPVRVEGRTVGFTYHRENDPLNGDHHVDLFLEPQAPAGTWGIRLVGEDVVDGRWYAWIERDSALPGSQSRLRADVTADHGTLGSIATGHRTLVVGAVDPRTGAPAPFSSAGPTRDGRAKPDIVAPGVGIVAARSTPPGAAPGSGGLVEMSGTSMASPHVAGTVALLFGRAPRRLNVAETRLLVLGSAIPLEGDSMRTGAGLLDTEAALAALRCMFQERKGAMSRERSEGREPRLSWSGVGTEEFEREMEAVLGPVGAYDVVGWPGADLQAPVQVGDVLLRANPASPWRPLVARVTASGLQGPELFPPGADAEGDGEGWYAEALERTTVGWAPAPAYRLVLDRNRVVRPGQIVLRPVAGGARPRVVVAPFVGLRPPPVVVMPPPAAVEEPTVPEPSAPGEEPPEDREDAPRSRRPVTTYDFSDEPVQITVPVTQTDASASEQEVEAAINTIGRWMLPFATAYLGGLDNFETNMLFAPDQETRPRYFDAALKEVGKAIVEQGLKHAFEKVPVLGEVVGVVKSIVVAWYEESERASKALGERRIAEYIVDARNQINQLVRALVQAIDTARPKLLSEFRAAVARSAPGQGQNRVLTGDAAQFILQLRETVARLRQAVPTPERIQQLFTERFIGPPRLTTYISHGGRESATLYVSVDVLHDAHAAKPWTVKGAGSSWTIPSLSPHPDRLATSLKSAMLAQGREVWRTNLPKMVHLNIEEEVTGLNEYHDGWVRFFADPAVYDVRSNYGLAQFDQAWRVPEIRAAALRVNDLTGAEK